MPQRSRATNAPGPHLKAVVSDLHLSDGDPVLENWQPERQGTWERLLERLSAQTAAGARSVELIVNGDAFDLLVAGPPLGDRDATDAATALAKIAAVTDAHPDWCSSLRSFLTRPGHALTFTIGNHDLELAFPAVRAHLRRAIGAPAGAVRFCLARGYRPFPDVHIEHGCQTDPWNRIPDLWDAPAVRTWSAPRDLELSDTPASGQASTDLALPIGSRYYYRVFRPIQRRFPYFDALLPSLPQPGILALLCLMAPDLVVVGSARALTLRTEPAPPPAPIPAAVAADPAQLFAATLPDVAGLQADVWQATGTAISSADQAALLTYIMGLHAGLQAGEDAALRAIFAITDAVPDAMPSDDAAAAAAIFGAGPHPSASASPGGAASHPPSITPGGPRWALVGHTHVESVHPLPGPARGNRRTLVNTGTWYSRLALPAPAAVTPALAAWLRDPHTRPAPLASATVCTYALVRGGPRLRSTVELARAD